MADTIRRTKDFLGEVQTEMSKVTWPDWPQLKNATLVILVFVILIALVIFGFDIVVRAVLGVLISILGG